MGDNFVQDGQPGRDALVELRNGRFADVAGGLYFDSRVSVLVKGGRIVAMPGLPGEPAGVCPDLSVDLQGRAVIPGLINTHSHVQMGYPSLLLGPAELGLVRRYARQQIEKRMADCLARGVTCIRDTLTPDLRLNRALRERIERGDIPGPRIYQCVLVAPRGGTFTRPQGPLEYLTSFFFGAPPLRFDDPASGAIAIAVDADPAQARGAVDRAIDERAADGIKFYDQQEFSLGYKPGAPILSDAQLEAAADQARRRGVKTTMHHVNVAGFWRGTRAGVSSLAHLPYDARLSPADVDAFAASGCMLEPTFSLAYYTTWDLPGAPWRQSGRLAELNAWRERTYRDLTAQFWVPEMVEVARSHFVKAANGQVRAMGCVDMSAVLRYWGGLIDHGVDNLRLLLEAGIPVTCSNDAGAVPAVEAMVGHELAMLDFCLKVEGGTARLGGAEALRIATINGARALGLEDRMGSIQTGKLADLAVLDGDPLVDPSRVGSRVAALFKGGRLVVDNCGLRLLPPDRSAALV